MKKSLEKFELNSKNSSFIMGGGMTMEQAIAAGYDELNHGLDFSTSSAASTPLFAATAWKLLGRAADIIGRTELAGQILTTVFGNGATPMKTNYNPNVSQIDNCYQFVPNRLPVRP